MPAVKEVLSRVFSNPRTTLAGALGILGAVFGQYAVPALVAYFGGQPAFGWQGLGLLLGLIAPALMKDAAKKAVVGVLLLGLAGAASADSAFDVFRDRCVQVNYERPKANEVCACMVDEMKVHGVTEEELAAFMQPASSPSDAKVDLIGRLSLYTCGQKLVVGSDAI